MKCRQSNHGHLDLIDSYLD